jgi:hypothetical protein
MDIEPEFDPSCETLDLAFHGLGFVFEAFKAHGYLEDD